MINTMKQYAIALTFAVFAIAGAGNANAGIPTTDPGVLASAAVDLATKGVQYAKMYQEAQARLTTLNDTFRNNVEILHDIKGDITKGNFLWNRTLELVVPDQAEDLRAIYDAFDDVRNGGTITIDPTLEDEYRKIEEDMKCEDRPLVTDRNECKIAAGKEVIKQDIILNAMENMNERMDNIEDLMDEINELKSTKERDAMLARISIEETMLQAEQIKYDLYESFIAAQEEVEEERRNLNEGANFTTTSIKTFEPIDFSGREFGSWGN